jgi:hypothetical protein
MAVTASGTNSVNDVRGLQHEGVRTGRALRQRHPVGLSNLPSALFQNVHAVPRLGVYGVVEVSQVMRAGKDYGCKAE